MLVRIILVMVSKLEDELGCHGSRFFERNIPKQSDQKYIFCFFDMTQIPPKNIFPVEHILQKSPKKVGNFPKKSYGDFVFEVRVYELKG